MGTSFSYRETQRITEKNAATIVVVVNAPGRGGSNMSPPFQSILDLPLTLNKRKKVKKMVEHVIDDGDLNLVLSKYFSSRSRIWAMRFIHVTREVILIGDEDQEEGKIVTYAEEEDDIVTDDDDENDYIVIKTTREGLTTCV
uniref:Uncharacterized protein n=1 Tax=Oryza punctata TaxID=4537 RepID=A0A0E0LMF0_ORYPU